MNRERKVRGLVATITLLIVPIVIGYPVPQVNQCAAPELTARRRVVDAIDPSGHLNAWFYSLVSKIGYRKPAFRRVSIVEINHGLFQNGCQQVAFVAALLRTLHQEGATAIAFADQLPICADKNIRQNLAKSIDSRRDVFARVVNWCTLPESPFDADREVPEGLLIFESDLHLIPLLYQVFNPFSETPTIEPSLAVKALQLSGDVGIRARLPELLRGRIPPFTSLVDPKNVQLVSGESAVCGDILWKDCRQSIEQTLETGRGEKHSTLITSKILGHIIVVGRVSLKTENQSAAANQAYYIANYIEALSDESFLMLASVQWSVIVYLLLVFGMAVPFLNMEKRWQSDPPSPRTRLWHAVLFSVSWLLLGGLFAMIALVQFGYLFPIIWNVCGSFGWILSHLIVDALRDFPTDPWRGLLKRL